MSAILARSEDIAAPACRIFGAGDFDLERVETAAGDLIIAADGGLAHLRALKIKPHIFIGDFDSAAPSGIPDGVEILRHPVEKDDSDMFLAAKEGLRRKYHTFALYGGLGGARLSHTLANISLLGWLCENGSQGFLVSRTTEITAIKNGRVDFPPRLSGSVSVLASFGDARGVTIKGLKYETDGVALTSLFPLGLSNSFTGAPSSVAVSDGLCLIIREKKA